MTNKSNSNSNEKDIIKNYSIGKRKKKLSKRDRRKLFYNKLDEENTSQIEDTGIPGIIKERRLYTKKIRLSNDSSKKSEYDSNAFVIVPNKNTIINREKNNNINNENNNSDNENTFLNNEENINISDKEKGSNSDDDSSTVINNEKNLNNEDNNNSSLIGGKNDITNNEIANNNEENVRQEEDKKTFEKVSQIKKSGNTKRKYLYSSSDEENELQTYLNSYFSEKNIKKYSKDTQNNNNNNSNDNNINIDENNFQNEKEKNRQEKRLLANEKVNNFNNEAILESSKEKNNNKNETEIKNKNVNEKLNNNQENKSKNNKNEPKKPFMISSELLTRSNSNISEQERNISVNNLKNLIKRINSNQRLSQESQMTELENKGNNNVNNASNILSQTSSTGNDDEILLDIKYNNITREIHQKAGSFSSNSFDKSNIYFSYSNIFEDMDFSLSNSSIEYDNYLSKTIENSKKLISFPKVSENHKKLYVRYCRKLCKKTHKTKKELYELLHQCNGSFPAVKELLKMKNENVEEISDDELKKWIWTKEEDKILLTSKDEQQLKKIRIMKGNKSVRYRELYLEAKEIYSKHNSNFKS